MFIFRLQMKNDKKKKKYFQFGGTNKNIVKAVHVSFRFQSVTNKLHVDCSFKIIRANLDSDLSPFSLMHTSGKLLFLWHYYGWINTVGLDAQFRFVTYNQGWSGHRDDRDISRWAGRPMSSHEQAHKLLCAAVRRSWPTIELKLWLTKHVLMKICKIYL